MSLKDILKRRQQSEFIGRETQLDQFRYNLTLSPENSLRHFFFNIYGQGGVGKTFLLKQFQKLSEEAKAVSAYVNENEVDIPTVMGRIAKQFEDNGYKLSSFQQRYQTYCKCIKQLEADPEKPQGLSNLVGQTAAKVGISFGKKVPGVDVALDFVDQDAVAKQVGAWAAFVAKNIGNKDEVQLVQKPVEVLTPLFLQELMTIAKQQQITLFFDTYERTEKYLDRWLRNWIEEDYGAVPENIVVSIAGRYQLNRSLWANYESLLVRLPLEPFTDEEAHSYLSSQGISEPVIVETILQLSGNLPLLINTLVVNAPSEANLVLDATDTAVKRFLQWVDNPQQQQLALVAALPRRIDRDVLSVLVGAEEAKKQFDWLIKMPFVVDKPALIVPERRDRQYHSVVRELMLRYKYQQSPQEWKDLQGKLADYYHQIAENIGLTEDKATKDSNWQSYQLEAIYHRLCQSPQQYLTFALQSFLATFHDRRELASFWAEAIQEAGETTGNEAVLRWGKLLIEGINAYDTATYQPAINLFTAFLEELTEKQIQAQLYFWRGNTYRRMQEEAKGIEDFNRAISLYSELGNSEQLAVTTAHRAIAFIQKGDEDVAVADLDQAIKLKSNYYDAVASRGILYLRQENYNKALADFNRALENKIEDIVVLGNRGIVYRQLGQYESALHDFEQVIDIIPDNILALKQRGNTYQDLGEYEKALADFHQVLQLNLTNKDSSLYQNIVKAYISLGQTDKALEYCDRNKTLSLVELLANRDLYPKGNIPQVVIDDLDRLRREIATEKKQLLNQEYNFQKEMTLAIDKTIQSQLPDYSYLQNLQQQLNELIASNITPIDPNFSLTQKVTPIIFPEIQNVVSDLTTILYWYITNNTIFTFIITSDRDKPIVQQISSANYDSFNALKNEYLQILESKEKNYKQKITSLLACISRSLCLDEIKSIIPNRCNKLILVPHGFLSLLPIHAFPLVDSSILLEHYDNGISYIPSCQLLDVIRKRQAKNINDFFAVQNPKTDSGEVSFSFRKGDLSFSSMEVETIKRYFSSHEILAGEQAKKKFLISRNKLSNVSCLHFSCRAIFKQNSPLESGLGLANNELLTLGEVFELDFQQCNLVTLSGSKTGLTDYLYFSDEYIGLPSGFLYAGSSNVVSSLWAVNDLSTALLMIKFYQNLAQNNNVAVALNQAQLWLRKITNQELNQWIKDNQLPLAPSLKIFLKRILYKLSDDDQPFKHPYYWAAFCAIGQ